MSLTWSRVDSFRQNFTSAELGRWRSCPVCGSEESRARLELTNFQFYSDSADLPKRFDVRHVQCAQCAALYMNPCYSAFGFATLFAEAGQSYGSARHVEQRDWLARRGLLRPNGHVLDVGCYDGQFLASLPAETRRTGVDLDLPAIERARARFGEQGVELIHGDFESFAYDGHPDTITMFHVLEHLPNPVPTLMRLRSIAHDRTRLVVEVPVLERASTNDINGFLTVQHLTHFSVGSLQACLHQAGWAPTEAFQPAGYNGWRTVAHPSVPSPWSRLRTEDLCGASAGQAGSPGDVDRLHDYLSHWNRALAAVVRHVESCSATNLVLWGSGTHAELLYQLTPLFRSLASRHYALIDTDPLKHGTTWRGIAIHPPAAMASMSWADTQLIISSYGSQDAIAKAAVEIGVPEDRLVRLYDHTASY